jgi:hypothetical protein
MSAEPSYEPVDDPYYARWSYERLLLLQPHIRVAGLWRHDQWFYAVCPDLEEGLTADDGQQLSKWFNNKGRAASSPIRLVSRAPDGAVRVRERSAKELAELRGVPLTVANVETCLAVSLPVGFPDFRLQTIPPDAYVYVASQLTPAQRRILEERLEPLRGGLRLTVIVDTEQACQPPSMKPAGLELIASKRLPSGFGGAVKRALEEDEEFWVRERQTVLASDFRKPAEFLPDAFCQNDSRCLVNASVFPPKNLRTYLSLYRNVAIVMPLAGSYPAILKSLRVNEDELIELARRRRIQFLLPQPVIRYPPRLLARLAELEEQHPLLLSRRLAAATIADCRRRIPLLYPPFGIAERRLLLEGLATLTAATAGIAKPIVTELGRIWSSVEDNVEFRGAMATGFNGVGALSSAVLKHLTGNNQFLELCTAASSVEWAAALNATVFPVDVEGYSQQAATELCASLYSGVSTERALSSSLKARKTSC